MMNKKILWICMFSLLLVPMVSADTKYFKALDLYNLFVENVFGNILFAGVGLAIILLVIGKFGKMSNFTSISVILLFLLTYLVGTYGGWTAYFIFGFTAIYFSYSVWKFFGRAI